MSKISDARKDYKPSTNTLTILLSPNDDVAMRRDELLGKIATAAKEIADAAKPKASDRLTQKSALKEKQAELKELQTELTAIEAAEAEHMHTLRFTKLDGLAWAGLSAQFDPRPNVAFDLQLGYNHHAAALAAAKVNGVDVTSGDAVPLDDDDWATIQQVGTGWDIENIVTVVLELNVMRSARTIGRLKKD